MTTTATFLGSGYWNGMAFSTASSSTNFGIASCGLANLTTEASAQMITRAAGAFTRLGCNVTGARATSSTLKFRKDTGGGGADGNNAATLTGGATGWFQDATPHTDTVADGDKINMRITTGTGADTLTVRGCTIKFLGTSVTAVYLGWGAAGNTAGVSIPRITTNSVTTDFPLVGGQQSTSPGETTETAHMRFKLRAAGTLSHGQIVIITNGRGTNSTLIYRANNVTGNTAATITNGVTGIFEDTSHTDGISASDVSVWGITTSTGGGNLDFQLVSGKIVLSGTPFDLGSSNQTASDGTGSTTVTNYYVCWGVCRPVITESQMQMKIPFAVTASFMRAYVSQSQTGTITANFRRNTGNVNQTLSFTTGTTGLFEDASNTDVLADGDAICFAHGAMASVFGFNVFWWGMTLDPGGGGPTPGNDSFVHHYNTVILG
jgi:hypothetical protein